MPILCVKCSNSIKRSPGSESSIVCSSCQGYFHQNCVGIIKDALKDSSKWICSDCGSQEKCKNFNDSISKMENNIKELMLKQNSFSETLIALSNGFKEFRDLNEKVVSNEKNIIQCKTEIQKLQRNVEQLHVQGRERNIIITGVPFQKTECVVDIVLSICKALNVDVSRDKMQKCTRIVTMSKVNKPIMVIFQSIWDAKSILSAFKTKGVVHGTVIGLDDNVKIRIGEHLTTLQQSIFRAAKAELLESGKYKFVWIQNGGILARREGDKKIHKIKSIDDVKALQLL